ncbi:low affinity immunoglobulin epsilon Fc receptor-like [Polypterus senegalus]|uniref:low affinity immunoglobulin epsilon Fc receptor-like n=1 Tax=Polypterus senegalus TaxID=55291 RepID=UPI0019665177|nr:low affinity immunoglobulin epsilon Fc receptor-like [Polypterus senegalus]
MMKIFGVLLVAGLVSLSVYYFIKLNHKDQELEELRNPSYILTSKYSALSEDQATLQSEDERNNSELQESRDMLKAERKRKYSELQSKYVTLNEKLDEVTKEFSVLKEIYCDGTNTSPDNTCSLCKPGWVLFSSKCYFISTNKLTWKESRDWCETRRGRLVNIESSDLQDFLKSKDEGDHWIGGYNISKENKSTKMGAEPVKSKRASDDDKEECLR